MCISRLSYENLQSRLHAKFMGKTEAFLLGLEDFPRSEDLPPPGKRYNRENGGLGYESHHCRAGHGWSVDRMV